MPPCTCSADAMTRFDASEHQIFAVDAAIDASGSSGADAPRGPVHGRTHALDVDEHVGAAVLHRLERTDRPTELHAVLGVLDRHVERARRRLRADRPRRRSRRGRSAGRAGRRHRAGSRARPSTSSQPSSRVRSIAGSRCGGSTSSTANTPSASHTTARSADGAYGTGCARSHATHARASPREQALDPRGRTGTARRRRWRARPVRTVPARRARRAPRPGSATSTAPSPMPPSDSGTSMPSQPCSTIASQSARSNAFADAVCARTWAGDA